MKEFAEKLIEKFEKEAFAVQSNQGIKHPSTHDMFLETFTVRQIEEIIEHTAEEYKEKDCSQCSRRSWYQIGYADAQKNNGWIPCSERLPEIDKWVLGQGVHDMMLVCYTKSYRGDFDWMDINGDRRVISAWQPLPEPYQKGE